MYDIPRSTPTGRIDSDNRLSVVAASLTGILLFVAMVALEPVIGLLAELTVSSNDIGLMMLYGGMLSVAVGVSKVRL